MFTPSKGDPISGNGTQFLGERDPHPADGTLIQQMGPVSTGAACPSAGSAPWWLGGGVCAFVEPVASAIAERRGAEEEVAVAGCSCDLAFSGGFKGDGVHGSGAFLGRYRRILSAAVIGLSPRRGRPRLVFVTVGVFVTLSTDALATGILGLSVTARAFLRSSLECSSLASPLIAGQGWRDQCLVLQTMHRGASMPHYSRGRAISYRGMLRSDFWPQLPGRRWRWLWWLRASKSAPCSRT